MTTLYGTTGTGIYANKLTDPEDWEYISFTSLFPYEMRPVCQELYEIVIVRRENGDAFEEIFNVHPDLENWRVQDLFSKHLNKDDVKLYRGRTEDLIISSLGETFLPKSMEGMIESRPIVDAALVTDRGQAGLALLVKPQAAVTCVEMRMKALKDSNLTEEAKAEVGTDAQNVEDRDESLTWRGLQQRGLPVRAFLSDMRKAKEKSSGYFI